MCMLVLMQRRRWINHAEGEACCAERLTNSGSALPNDQAARCARSGSLPSFVQRTVAWQLHIGLSSTVPRGPKPQRPVTSREHVHRKRHRRRLLDSPQT